VYYYTFINLQENPIFVDNLSMYIIIVDYLRSTEDIFTDVKSTNCRICNIYATIKKYAFSFKYAEKKPTIESTHNETSTFMIKIILGEL